MLASPGFFSLMRALTSEMASPSRLSSRMILPRRVDIDLSPNFTQPNSICFTRPVIRLSGGWCLGFFKHGDHFETLAEVIGLGRTHDVK